MQQWTRSRFALLAAAFCLEVAVGCGGGGSTTTTTPPPPVQNGPPSGSEFLYAFGGTGTISPGGGSIYVSSLNSAGQLTEPVDVTPQNLPVVMLEQLPAVAFGKNIYVPCYDQEYFTDAVFPFSITGTKGQLAAQSNYPVNFGGASNLQDFLVDGLGRYLYANGRSGGQISICRRIDSRWNRDLCVFDRRKHGDG